MRRAQVPPSVIGGRAAVRGGLLLSASVCFTAALLHCCTASLLHCFTASLLHCSWHPLLLLLLLLLLRVVATAALLLCCSAALLLRCTAALLHCCTASLLLCFTASLLHCSIRCIALPPAYRIASSSLHHRICFIPASLLHRCIITASSASSSFHRRSSRRHHFIIHHHSIIPAAAATIISLTIQRLANNPSSHRVLHRIVFAIVSKKSASGKKEFVRVPKKISKSVCRRGRLSSRPSSGPFWGRENVDKRC